MNARNKLNVAFVNGSLLVAGLAGLVFESWIAFFLVLVAAICTSMLSGDIRTTRMQ